MTDLPSGLGHVLEDHAVGLDESLPHRDDSMAGKDFVDERNDLPKTRLGKAGEQMVFQLELQSTVGPIHERGTGDVHRREGL